MENNFSKAQETLSKLIELENKDPDKVKYIEGLIDGLMLGMSNDNAIGDE